MIITTAGHIDHGETTLLQAITDVNADRLPEEKKRGMTIGLSYAYWPQPNGRVSRFTDVPGYEKFLSNMLARVGGVDHALLVMTRDDDVMVQTREHLQILQLMGNPQITTALTKADHIDETRIEEVHAEIQATLGNYGFTELVLSVTMASGGCGIEELRSHLLQLTPREYTRNHSFRLTIDRAFTAKGVGLVVTGTALSNEVNVGGTLWLTGVNESMRVRSLHTQNQATSRAQAGQRIALGIVGDAQRKELSRGGWLSSDAPPEAFTHVIVSLECITPLI